jgi:hypothetical protein
MRIGNVAVTHAILERIGNVAVTHAILERIGNVTVTHAILERIGNVTASIRYVYVACVVCIHSVCGVYTNRGRSRLYPLPACSPGLVVLCIRVQT